MKTKISSDAWNFSLICFTSYYRPQRSCSQGYVFTRVWDSVHRGGSASVHAEIPHPPGKEAPSTPGRRQPPSKADLPPEADSAREADTPQEVDIPMGSRHSLISFAFTFDFARCERALNIILVVITNLTTIWSVTLRSYGGFCICGVVKSFILLLFLSRGCGSKMFR